MKTMKKNGGFTLVELIVVIAILAILAAVAIPAYSGYIEKANRAGDETLLAAVNKAFASACSANGNDVYFVDSAVAPLKDGKVDVTKVSPYGEDFALFYEGNENAQFKVIERIVFDAALHMFVDPATATEVTVNYDGVNLTISGEKVTMVGASTFMQAETLGSEVLLGMIDTTQGLASGLIGTGAAGGTLISNVLAHPDFTTEMVGYLGNPADLQAKQKELAQKMVDAGLAKDLEEAGPKLAMNAAVVFAAQNTAQMSTTDAMAFLTGADVKMSITDDIDTDTTAALSNATLAYGMYTAFAHSTYGNAKAQGYNANDAMDHLNDTDFQAYLKTDTAKKDLEAYLAALSIINSTTQDSAAMESVLVNGYTNDELKNTVGGLFGK